MTHTETSLKVLLIEDEAIIAMDLEDMLVGLGHQVVATAGRLDRATRLATDLAIDLAIVDVNLNGVQTYPVAEILSHRGVPFIFSTGYGTAGLNEEWRGKPTLQKPFQGRQLAAAIEHATAAPSGPESVK